MSRLLRISTPTVLLLAAALAPTTPPAAADWLVLRDGSRIETKGPWQAKGRLLVFEKAEATGASALASIRADEVDVAASRAATEEALKPPPPPVVAPAAPTRPVLVLTDEDIPKAFDAETGEGGQPGDTVALRVTSWERLDTDNGIEVTGVIRNDSDAVAQNVTVRVIALDDKRNSLGTAGANVSASELPPGQTTMFRALLAGFKKVGGLRFETSGTRKTDPAAEGQQAGSVQPPV